MTTLTKDSLIVSSRQIIIDSYLSQQEQLLKQQSRIEELEFQLAWLKRQIFGTKSERILPSSDMQMALDLGVVSKNDVEGDVPTESVTYDRRKKWSDKKPVQGHGRGTMPTHLPIKEVVIEPDQDTTGLDKIEDEISWYYEMDKPSSLHVVKIVRPKYALPKKSGVVVAKLPKLPVEKGNAGPGFIAHITAEKYLYHMPLDRQRKKFKVDFRTTLSDSWLSDTIGRGVFWLDAAYEEYRKKLLKSTYLQADETPIPVLTRNKKGKTHRGYLWVYHDPIRRLVLFDYRRNRSHEGPSDFLKDFHGTLQVDGYEGYADIIRNNGLVHAGCMDHVRRRFEKAKDYDAVRATYALDTMREWYAVEREARENNLTPSERLVQRKDRVDESMRAFGDWMRKQLLDVLPKSPIGVALQYALNQWKYFKPYLSDGRVELSNILIENAIRPVALGRKNFLFAGSHNAARWPAVIYSLAAIAQNHGIAPFDYFKELLTELPKLECCKDVSQLLIPEWKPQADI